MSNFHNINVLDLSANKSIIDRENNLGCKTHFKNDLSSYIKICNNFNFIHFIIY